MRIRWMDSAKIDLQELHQYITRDDRQAAKHIAKSIQKAVSQLEVHPQLGRAGRVLGTRELIVAGTPYLVAYRVKHSVVMIVRILHGAMLWPSSLS